MILDDRVLDDNEVNGVSEVINDTKHPVRWMFRDDDKGFRFVNYCKWLDELETEYYKIISTIFTRFCSKHGIDVSEVHMARMTMLVHNDDESPYLPETGYPFSKNVFVYFVSSSDRPFYVGDTSIIPKTGLALSFDYNDGYRFSPPHHDNFFIMIEVEYS